MPKITVLTISPFRSTTIISERDDILRNSAGKSVKSVDEVDCVGESCDPEDSERDAEVSEMHIRSAEVDMVDDTAVPNSKSCRGELYNKLQPCVKAVDMVVCSENDKHRSAYPYCDELLINIARGASL